MICAEAEILLQAFVDGEIDAAHALETERHVQGCSRCARTLHAYRQMRRTMAARELRVRPPPDLRKRVEAALDRANVPDPGRRSMLKGFAMGAALSTALAASLLVAVIRADDRDRVLGELISAHLRSLQSRHLTDVETSDQHTVKPWFNGKISVAPPVLDLAGDGYRLVGGRLDYLGSRPVAVVVYRHDKHVINLYVASARATPEHYPAKMQAAQGFNVRAWREDGLDFWAVSDIEAKSLETFGATFDAALVQSRHVSTEGR